MRWKVNVAKEYDIVRKRRLFAWFPRVGSDLKWHWLESFERWERTDSISVSVLSEETGGTIYTALNSIGVPCYHLVEGRARRKHNQ